MAQTAQGKGLLSHSRLESKVPTVLTPSQQHLLCFWGKKEQDAPTSWNKEKIKKQDMVSIFQIVCRLYICGAFHSKINCVLKRVWNSRAFMLPSF